MTFEDYGAICRECAHEKGGRWPDHHVATIFPGTCPYCNEEKSLAGTNDYLWPDEDGNYPDRIPIEKWD